MHMIRFKVQSYKNINDTDWVNCDDLTAFVGKNEAGKSAIFRGLSKLNPSDEEKYNGLKEFPRRRYTAEFKTADWPCSSAEFELSDDESEDLKEICSLLNGVKSVLCTRYYSDLLEIDFKPRLKLPTVSYGKYLELLKNWNSIIENMVAPEGKGEQFAPIKTALLQFLSLKIKAAGEQDSEVDVDAAVVDEVGVAINGKVTEEWLQTLFKKIIDDLKKFRSDLEVSNQIEEVYGWVAENLPKFVYFDEYDVIESAVHFPTFVRQLNATPSAPRVRTTKCLFENVGLDVTEILKLDPSDPKGNIEKFQEFSDERAILMSSASNTMTKRFANWWEQRKHKFAYKVDGPFFRIWVSDNLDPSDIELEERSYGMRYFFSFYLVFLQEAKGAYSNAILLLDEPGLHLHGTAQQKILKFFEKLSKDNQLLYSTHSPFMVDPDHLERVRVVHNDKEGYAQVSEDVWPRDKDALFPLQAGLGYAIVQTLFYAKRQVVVEGITDYNILKAVNSLLLQKKMGSLRKDAVIVPCGGVNKLLPLASMLLGHEIKLGIVLDGDEPGKRKGEEVTKRLSLNCLFMNTYAGKKEAELEDLFPETLYLDAVKEAYPDVKTPIKFSSDELKLQCITKRVAAAFDRLSAGPFEKWGPSRVLVDWIWAKPDLLPKETLKKFEAIFKALNKILA